MQSKGSKRVFILVGALLSGVLSAVLLPPSAYAETVAANGASAGVLITAVFEEVGYRAQAQTLAQLSQMIEMLGALVYLGCIVSAVLTVALLGQYKAALWLLVGPALFIWASGVEVNGQKNRIQGSTEWRFGAFDDSQVANDKQELLRNIALAPPGEVSFFFHKYNELISEGVQKLVDIITNSDIQNQMLFMARQQTMEDLFGEQIVNPGINSLIGYFMVHCNSEITYARLIALGNRDPEFRKDPQYAMAKEKYCDLFPKAKEFTPGPWQRYVYEAGWWDGTGVSRADHLTYLRDDPTGVVSCKEMWSWIVQASKYEALKGLTESAAKNVDKNAWLIAGATTWNKVVRDVRKFLESFKNVEQERTNSPGDPCPQASGSDTPDGGQLGQDFDVLARIFAGYLVRKEMMHTPTLQFMQRVATGHDGFAPDDGVSKHAQSDPIKKGEVYRRQKAHEFATARKYEAFMLLNTLPYIQGAILFVLAVIYPFFALMLIVPGKAGSFFTWMSLWAWAKCWDVGWAMIVVADKILWELLPKAAFANPNNQTAYRSPVSLLEIAFDGDHAYTIATYWMLLSGMILGVPIVTGHAVMGAKKAMAGVMLKGVTDFADVLSKGAADWVGSGHTRGEFCARVAHGAGEMQRAALQHYHDTEAGLDAIADTLGDGLLSETVNMAAKTADYKGKTFDKNAARTAVLSAALKHQAGLINDAQYKAVQQAYEDLAAGQEEAAEQLKPYMEQKGAAHDVRGDGYIAMSAKVDPTGQLAKLLFGPHAGPQDVDQWLKGRAFPRIAKALGMKSLTGDGASQYIADDDLAREVEKTREDILLQQLYAMQYRDLAETKAFLGLPAAGFGYGAGGLLGGYMFLTRQLDNAAHSNRTSYEYQYQRTTMDIDLQKIVTGLATYELFNDTQWLQHDYGRAWVSINRGEWVHKDNFTNSYWHLEHLRTEAETFMRRMDGREFGGGWARYLLDLGPTGTAVNGGR